MGCARRHRPRHLPPRRRQPLGRRHDVGQRRAALRHSAEGAAADLQHALQRLRARVLHLRRRQLPAVLQPPGRVHRPRRTLVLDGVLYHESDLDLEEHYTDTHGYTEINFAAFGMVGMRFCPRIRSLHRQRIYCADPNRDHGVLEPVLKRVRRAVNFRLIAEQWDRIGQFLRGVPRGARHRDGRPAEAQPVPGVEPLLRDGVAVVIPPKVGSVQGRARRVRRPDRQRRDPADVAHARHRRTRAGRDATAQLRPGCSRPADPRGETQMTAYQMRLGSVVVVLALTLAAPAAAQIQDDRAGRLAAMRSSA